MHLFLAVSAGILYTFESFHPQGTKLNFTARQDAGVAANIQLSAGINRFDFSNGQNDKRPHSAAFFGLEIIMGMVYSLK
jgi:hypothetical protein